MHGLRDDVGEVVGLLLVSILDIWIVSQLQGHSCTEYRYVWHMAFPSTLALRWLGSMVLQAVGLVTTLVSSFKLLFLAFPLTLLCSLWGQFASKIGICLCLCLSPRLPLLTRLKALLRKTWEGVVPILIVVSKYMFHSKNLGPRAVVPLYPKHDHQFPIPTVLQQSFADFQLHFQ